VNTQEVVELFDGGWLPLGEGLPHVRVIVARHPAPPAGQEVAVGKRIDEWVIRASFSPILTLMAFSPKMSWTSLMDVEPKIAVLADEDVEEDPDRWCSYVRRFGIHEIALKEGRREKARPSKTPDRLCCKKSA
jgi:hypothetical protein